MVGPRTTREAALQWVSLKLDTPYRWGGNEVKDGGFDCSGLQNGALRKFGITHRDHTAADLAEMFPEVDEEDIQPGDLVFWQSGTKIVHVEMVWFIQPVTGKVYTIGASSGGPWVTTLSAAERADARVKIHERSGWVKAVNPYKHGE